jgi:hypothetical protein
MDSKDDGEGMELLRSRISTEQKDRHRHPLPSLTYGENIMTEDQKKQFIRWFFGEALSFRYLFFFEEIMIP